MTSLNAEIITSFTRLAERERSRPLVVHFPSRSDFQGADRSVKDGVLTRLRERGIRYEDLTSCLKKLKVSEVFIEGRPHYSPRGNAKVATCLRSVVLDHLPKPPSRMR